MTKVFTGKMIIPGNQIEAFLEKIKDAEDEIEPFRKYLNEINKEFEEYLTDNFSAKTARKHCYKVDWFIDFLCLNTDVKCIAEITRGIANSHFRKWYMSKVGDCSESDLKTAIKKFFQFIATEKGITNEAVLKSFK